MKQSSFDVIVIGGGHAGCEAAHAAARMGASVALITLDVTKIGTMSCNPAIGGLGKGHLVREIDAFDGVMGRVADAAGIQFRLLNRRKGPAVRGPRAQSDREVYRKAMQAELSAQEALTIIEGEVADLLVADGAIEGVRLGSGGEVHSRAVVVTTGTFLGGTIHIGDQSFGAGRMGEAPSNALAERFHKMGLPMGRLKTGTPPRLDGRTIDWAALDMQPADDDPTFFSFLTQKTPLRQIACGITFTNSASHDIIRANLGRSAMYGGRIDGIGPRYCPSIEDKVVKFAEKDSHQVFLEPEGLTNTTVYPNGISTSLPEEVQVQFVRTMRGLEEAEIQQPGYAIEYDFVDPRALTLSLQVKAQPGLFLAGQINGTTGYEEAAAQGLVAGLNAVLRSRAEGPVTFSRSNSYIGVMIDDLTSRGVAEPYRMFTSRAEFRLSLRADNADQRLTQMAIDLGCVSDLRHGAFRSKMSDLEKYTAILSKETWKPREVATVGVAISDGGGPRSSYDLLSFPKVTFADLEALRPAHAAIPDGIKRQISCDALYAKYVDRQARDVDMLKREEALEIPPAFNYGRLSGLSNELSAKLSASRPSNIAQAARLEGMTPAALTLLVSHLRAPRTKHAG